MRPRLEALAGSLLLALRDGMERAGGRPRTPMDRKQSTTNGAHPEHEQLGRTDARTAASEKQESTADLLRREIARLRTDLEILIRTKLDTVRARVLSVALGAALGLLFL